MKKKERHKVSHATKVGLSRWEEYFREVISRSPSPKKLEQYRKKYRHFAETAIADIDFLTARGADPAVLTHIVYMDLWLSPTRNTWKMDFSRDARRITSAEFWLKQRSRMAEASRVMEEFKGNIVYRQWDQFHKDRGMNTNLDGVFAKMHAAAQALEEAIKIIDEKELKSGAWEVCCDSNGPRFLRTNKKGRRKSGRYRRDDWASVGAGLVYYIKKRTGQAHYGHVCRLLAAAGVDDFTDGNLNEADLLRKGIKCLETDDAAMYGVFACLADSESGFELHEVIPRAKRSTRRVKRRQLRDDPRPANRKEKPRA